MAKIVVDERSDGVRILTLNDPDRRNAIDREMRAELADAVSRLAQDEAARVLVVRGAGTAFCAGGDLPDLVGPPGRPVDDMRDDLRLVYDSFLSLRTLAIPTIAAVHGPAVGAGLNLALCCDLRIMGGGGYLDARFAKIGLHPGGGCSYFLVQALGRQGALEVLLRGRRLDAAECVQRGLALHVADDPLGAAIELAHEIAQCGPHLARSIKRAVDIATDVGLPATVDYEAWAQAASLAHSPAVLRPRNRRAEHSPRARQE